MPLASKVTGLSQDSVANVSQLVTLDKSSLTDRVGKLSKAKLDLVLFGIDVVLGHWLGRRISRSNGHFQWCSEVALQMITILFLSGSNQRHKLHEGESFSLIALCCPVIEL